LNALIFLFREVLRQETEAIGAYTRASTQKRLPTVLSQEEVRRMLCTTMIYIHVIKKGGLAVQSPFDVL
jgi:site-specific recombinase XerD